MEARTCLIRSDAVDPRYVGTQMALPFNGAAALRSVQAQVRFQF